MNKQPRVFIVIPVHNRSNFTRQCLCSLNNQTCKNFQVIVIDDGSTDGTSEMIMNEFPDTVLIKGDGNLWWTGAMNLGVKYALTEADEHDFILTLNNDLYVDENYLQSLINAYLQHPDSLIGSIILNANKSNKIVDGGVTINWLTAKFENFSKALNDNSLQNLHSQMIPVDTLPGRGTLVPVKVFRKIGLYNQQKLPHYEADYEFAIRAKKHGFGLYISYASKVYSYVEATGLNNKLKKTTWADLFHSFFSIKSPNNIRYRWNFALLCSPKHLTLSYFCLDVIRVLVGSIRTQVMQKS